MDTHHRVDEVLADVRAAWVGDGGAESKAGGWKSDATAPRRSQLVVDVVDSVASWMNAAERLCFTAGLEKARESVCFPDH